MVRKSPLIGDVLGLHASQAVYSAMGVTEWWVMKRVASIFHTLAARQEPHYPGFQPAGRPCYPQVLSIVSCHIIRLQLQLFIEAQTELHDSGTACIRVRTSRCTVTCCNPHPEVPPANRDEH